MAALNPHLVFENQLTGTTYATSVAGEISTWTIDRGGDAPAHVHFEIGLGTALATALIAATGGPSTTDPLIPLLGSFSLDGGTTVDVAFVLTSAQRSFDPTNPLLIIDQDDQAAIYTVNGVDRVTYVEIPVDGAAGVGSILSGEPNTIPRPAGAIGTNRSWVYTKGLDKTTVAPAGWLGQPQRQMHMVAHPRIASRLLSVDINSDMLTSSIKTIAGRLAGVWDAGDPAPPGARGHWASMSGSGARNPTGIEKALALGWVGESPKVTFDGDSTAATWDETTTARFASQGMLIDPQLAEMYYQTCFIGGISDHGIDTGMSTSGGQATEITCCVAINTDRAATSTLWDDSLPIVGTTAGVYYYPHHGALIPMSQRFVVNALAYHPGGTLYAATPGGVFFGPSQPPPLSIRNPTSRPPSVAGWSRLGGLSAPVEDVWMDGDTIIARCGGSTKKNGKGVDGIYCYPALTGDHTGDTQGYAGWSRIAHSGSPLAAGGTVANLYYTDANKPGIVYRLQPGTANAPIAVLTLPAGINVIGIDTPVTWNGTANGHVYVRTDGGAPFTTTIQVSTGIAIASDFAGGIRSSDGAIVQIRRISGYGLPLFGQYVALLAATDAGLFVTGFEEGTAWSPPNAKSGLGDFDIDFAVAGVEQTILTRRTVRLFAGAKRSFLISNNAGDNWTDLLASKLDKGPFWAELARQCGQLPWVNNDVGNLGTLPDGVTETGGSGTTVQIPSTNKRYLPVGWLWARRLDEQCNFVFRLINVMTRAPLAGIQYHELSDLQANANIGVITASEAVALVEWRWLSAVSVPRQALTLQASFTQDNAALRDLTFGDQSRVLYNPSGWTSAAALDLILYVTRHRMTGRTGYVATETTVASTLESGPLDPDALAAALADRLTKKIRWGSA